MGEALKQIRQGVALDDVALGHGYESFSGFRDAFERTFGQPPGRSRATDCIIASWVESPLGPLVIGATPRGFASWNSPIGACWKLNSPRFGSVFAP